MKYCNNCQNVPQRHSANRCGWENDVSRLAQLAVATHLQFVKNAAPVNCNKAKHNKIDKSDYPLLVTAKDWKQPKYSLVKKWLNKLRNIHKARYNELWCICDKE